MNIKNKTLLFIFTIILACVGGAQASDESMQFIGDYRHVTSATGEHCDGYDVVIWKYKGSLVGFLYHHRGLCGDPPMGVMEETIYSAQTGSVSFKVKISDGCTFQDGKCMPTKDTVVFEGKLHEQLLKGVVTWFRLGKLQATESEHVTLTKDLMPFQTRDYATYSDWMKYWEPILKVRGPRW